MSRMGSKRRLRNRLGKTAIRSSVSSRYDDNSALFDVKPTPIAGETFVLMDPAAVSAETIILAVGNVEFHRDDFSLLGGEREIARQGVLLSNGPNIRLADFGAFPFQASAVCSNPEQALPGHECIRRAIGRGPPSGSAFLLRQKSQRQLPTEKPHRFISLVLNRNPRNSFAVVPWLDGGSQANVIQPNPASRLRGRAEILKLSYAAVSGILRLVNFFCINLD